ncbi:hypothetical protein AB0K00_45900 [Dactylosporangium sp. NPDC049525]|uniref:WD40 repeat domain-containing protein n=1 Tax=Dactylosporangium sp. NPDC049525 TaxID=3154730 RepID=UPI003439A74E
MFDTILGLLRRGQTDEAARLAATAPGEWLPRWAAGEPLSRGLHQVHHLRDLIFGVRLDATHAWAASSDTIHRIDRTDGTVETVPLEARYGYSPDVVFVGDTLVTVAEDRLLVWEVRTGRLLVSTDPDDIPGPAGKLCALDAAGGVAVTGTANGYLLLWDLTDGRRLAKVAAHDGYVNTVAVSVDEPAAVLSIGGDQPSEVRFWTLDGLRPTAGPAATGAEAACGAWTDLGGARRAVTVDYDGVLRIWDPRTATALATFPTGARVRDALAFAGPAAVLPSGRFVRIVDLTTGAVSGVLRTTFELDADHVTVHGRTVFVTQFGSTEGRVNLLDLDALEPADPRGDLPSDRLDCKAAVPTGTAIVGVGSDGLTWFLDPDTGRPVRDPAGSPRFPMGQRRLFRLTVDGRETLVAVASTNITVLDPDGTVRHPEQRSPFAAVLCSAAADDTGPVPLVAALDPAGNIAVWDVRGMRLHAHRRGRRTGRIRQLALGAGALLIGESDGHVRWLDPTDLTETRAPRRVAKSPVTALSVLATAVAAAAGTVVATYDIRSTERVGPPLAHPAPVRGLLVAEFDGAPVVVTGCEDGSIRIWDPVAGACLERFPAPLRVDQLVAAGPGRITVLTGGVLVQIAHF